MEEALTLQWKIDGGSTAVREWLYLNCNSFEKK